MIRKESEGIHWLEFELLSDIPRLKHGIFTRKGGQSLGVFSSLNLGYEIGDDEEHVSANLLAVQKTLSLKNLISAKQCHGKEIGFVTPSCKTRSLCCDVLTTSHTDLGLLIKHADCQAAILYDPIEHAVTVAHVGWRGNVQNVYQAAIEDMVCRYGTKPQNLLIGISPSLGPKNAEFIHYQSELPRAFDRYQVNPTYFDLWEISRFQLMECGVLSHHIEIAKIDTYESIDEFYSYRKEKITGRNGTVATLL